MTKKVILVGCGHYMDSGYGCPGEWRCLKAASLGEGKFSESVSVTAFVRCECPGRPLLSNIGMAVKLSGIKPDAVHLTSCMATAKPGCPYLSMEDVSKMIADKFNVPVVQGTHEYK